MSNYKYWEHKNLNFFSYNSGETMRTAEAGTATLSDWNRHVRANESCPYFINGVKLSDLRDQMLKEGKCDKLEFSSVEDLKSFFKEYIFKNLSSEEADLAAEHASLQCHQAGIQHATYQHAGAYVLNHFSGIGLSEPKFTVHFDSTDQGATITENNEFYEWVEMPSGKKHTRNPNEEYYAYTSTMYQFTPKSIQIEKLVIDCPSRNLAPVFDKRPGEEQITRMSNRFFRALFAFIARFYSGVSPTVPAVEIKEDTQTTFDHPKLMK